MNTSTASRDHFRSIVADLAEKAKATLPDSAGRIDSAVKLVLSNDVELHDDGTATVGSRSNPVKTYSGVNGTCPCADFPRAPDGWCAHRIARALQLRTDRAMRTLRDAEASTIAQDTSTLAQASTPVPEEDDPAWHLRAPSLDDIGMVGAMPPRPPHTVDTTQGIAATATVQTSGEPDTTSTILNGFSGGSRPPLPEAPASINCYIMIAGRQAQLTLRDTYERRLLQRLAVVLEQFPLESPAQASMSPASPQTPTCKWHGVMKESVKAPGTWYCPNRMGDGSYCQERWPAKDGGRR